ncbi:MAG: TIM barrel protein [Verrucomicrobiota bacterium]
MKRRDALRNLTLGTGAVLPVLSSCTSESEDASKSAPQSDPWLKLAVQQYSFNKQLRSGDLTISDYPKTVVEGTGIKALEYFNGHMEEQVGKTAFFEDLRKRTDDLGAVNTMMLCRSKPALDAADEAERSAAIEGYKPWLEAMKILGGQCIRVDVRSPGDPEEVKQNAIAGLKALTTVADSEFGLDIVVENHGNHSGNGAWVAEVMKGVAMENCGTLPDFQNFKEYDPYQGVEEMMPWAKIICAKSKAFDAEGNETNVDFQRMLKIVKEAGFSGYIGIEFEGHDMEPVEGINLTRDLILRTMEEMA